MKKVLIVYGHPNYANSYLNQTLLTAVSQLSHVSISNLYAKYPDEQLDISAEQLLVSSHDLIIWQFPYYWYNTTPLLKKWIDEVFSAGFAYGPGSQAMTSKQLMLAITLGSSKARHVNEPGFSLAELLKPFEYTAKYCGLSYQRPLIVAAADCNASQLAAAATSYAQLLEVYTKQGSVAFQLDYPSID